MIFTARFSSRYGNFFVEHTGFFKKELSWKDEEIINTSELTDNFVVDLYWNKGVCGQNMKLTTIRIITFERVSE